MNRKLTPTFALIIAGALAAGIGLARPSNAAPQPAESVAAEQIATDDAAAESGGDGGYRTGTRTGNRGGTAAPAPAADDAGQAAGAAAEPDAVAAATITIEGFAFDGPESVAPGATLTVTNLDGSPHTLTFRSAEVDTGTLEAGATTTVTAPAFPGIYDYFCAIHPSMQGQLIVTG